MTRKRLWHLATTALLLSLVLVGCSSLLGGGQAEVAEPEIAEEAAVEPTATVEPPTLTPEQATATLEPPTPTPEPPTQTPVPTATPEGGLIRVYRNEYYGFSIGLPEGWDVVTDGYDLYAGPSKKALLGTFSEGRFLDPVIMIELAYPSELETDYTINTLTEDYIDYLYDSDSSSISEPVSLEVGGLEAMSFDYTEVYPDPEQEIFARLITVLGPQHAGAFYWISPPDAWEEFQPTFEVMLDSLEFFEPDPTAETEKNYFDVYEEETILNYVVGWPPEEATYTASLENGVLASYTLEDEGVHSWTFEANSGNTVSITAAPDSDDLDLIMTLITPAGRVANISDSAFSGYPERFIFEVIETGSYMVQIAAYDGEGGPYTMLLETTADEPLGEGEIRQWAVSATASSELADEYSASQATGAPDTYPQCGGSETGWVGASFDEINSLTLDYETPVIPTRLGIYQTLTPGTISKIELVDISNNIFVIYMGEPTLTDTCPYIMVLGITGVTEPIKQVIIYVDQSKFEYWTQIDAVELIGTP